MSQEELQSVQEMAIMLGSVRVNYGQVYFRKQIVARPHIQCVAFPLLNSILLFLAALGQMVI